MKTKLDYYRVFYETARFGSFSMAAQQLYISQSAISQCIRQLETDLNVKLFSRTRRGVSLTKEGSLLFQKNTSLDTNSIFRYGWKLQGAIFYTNIKEINRRAGIKTKANISSQTNRLKALFHVHTTVVRKRAFSIIC